jgi:NAD-specific glutamate dehydrogenase
LARSAVKSDLDWQQRALIRAVLQLPVKSADPVKRLAICMEKNKLLIERWRSVFTEIKANSSFEYSMLVVAVRELLELAQNNSPH